MARISLHLNPHSAASNRTLDSAAPPAMPFGTFSPCCSAHLPQPQGHSLGGSVRLDFFAHGDLEGRRLSASRMASVPSKLPAPLTRFVGREAELARAAGLLTGTRLLTLTGPGGAGKTRLALRLASATAGEFPDGVWFTDFSPLSDGEFVWNQVAVTLGVKEPGSGLTLAEAVCGYLQERRTLIVLDNCEHMVEAAAAIAARLLAAAAAIKIVATSREPLGVGGEVTWAVPPLRDADAIELFTDRARQVRPEFTLTALDAGAVRSICRRLDGLPLAIELAAARARAFDPAHIAAGLKDHLALLPKGPRTAPQRQATLAASFDWSHELLSDPERALLRQLSVFAGGFDVEAALAVCPAANLELLAALTDRSLIMLEQRSDQAEPRYRMLETVREFAAEHLDEAQEVELIRTRHRDHYLQLAEAAESNPTGGDFSYWRGRLFDEHENVRAALAWSRDRGKTEALARLTVAGAIPWLARGRYAESELWLGVAADRSADLPPLLQARIRNIECFLALNRSRLAEVPAMADEALAMARAAGDKAEEAFALRMLGLIAGLGGGAEAMRPYLDEARPLLPPPHVAIGTRLLMGDFLSQMGFILLRWFQSNPEEPRRLAEEGMERGRAGRNSPVLFTGMWLAGFSALIQGQLGDAAKLLQTALADGVKDDESLMWKCSLGLAWVAMDRGEFEAARAALDESVEAARKREFTGGSERMVVPVASWLRSWMQLADGDAARATDTLGPLVGAIRATPSYRWAGPLLVVLAEAQLAQGALDEATTSLDEATTLARSGSGEGGGFIQAGRRFVERALRQLRFGQHHQKRTCPPVAGGRADRADQRPEGVGRSGCIAVGQLHPAAKPAGDRNDHPLRTSGELALSRRLHALVEGSSSGFKLATIHRHPGKAQRAFPHQALIVLDTVSERRLQKLGGISQLPLYQRAETREPHAGEQHR